MSSSDGTDKREDSGSAVLDRNDSPCRTIITYSFSTAVHYQNVPQATPVRTYVVAEDPVRTPPPTLRRRSPSPEATGKASTAESTEKPQPGGSNSFPWKEVFAIQHITTTGNCPAPTPVHPHSSPSTPHPPPEIDISAAHKVNIHLAILVGGLTVGIIVITILTAVAGCIIYTRRRKSRSEKVGNRLSGVDDTLTCRSTNTVGSSRTTMTERRLRCQTGWQMKQFINGGALSPFSASDMSPSPSDKLEILARSGTLCEPSHELASHWIPPLHQAIIHTPESISDTCSTEAPSFLPGDDARYTLPRLHPQGSTTALTEVSCVATIDSNSNSVCANRSNLSPCHPSYTTANPTTSNINSLISHKAFVLSMMANQSSLQPTYPEPGSSPHLEPPNPALTSKRNSQGSQSLSESMHSDTTHESMYWINRQKS